jgi:hypothetical protein
MVNIAHDSVRSANQSDTKSEKKLVTRVDDEMQMPPLAERSRARGRYGTPSTHMTSITCSWLILRQLLAPDVAELEPPAFL